jgi:putative NADH-flavin reductase
MIVALIGSTGLAGKYISNVLLENNFEVKALIRNLDKAPKGNIEFVIGSAFDEISLSKLIENADVVINTIGQLKNEDGFYAIITQKILDIMSKNNVKRYIGITGASVQLKEDKKTLLGIIGSTIMNKQYPLMMKDKNKEIEIIKNSSLDWTIVRLPMVKDGTVNKKIKISLDKVNGTKIYNRQIAEFIINQINNSDYVHKFPIISQ